MRGKGDAAAQSCAVRVILCGWSGNFVDRIFGDWILREEDRGRLLVERFLRYSISVLLLFSRIRIEDFARTGHLRKQFSREKELNEFILKIHSLVETPTKNKNDQFLRQSSL